MPIRLAGLSLLLSILVFSGCSAPNYLPDKTLVRIRWSNDPETLDPLTLPNQNAIDAANLLHLGLLQVDFRSGTHAPALAQQLPLIRLLGDSLTSLDYYLRPEATWDNGRPVLATDVAFTLKLMSCPGLPNEKAYTQSAFIIDCRLDSANPRHFTLVCRGQAPDYLQASGDFPILPESFLDSVHTLRTFTLAAIRAATPVPPSLVNFAARYQHANVSRHPERLAGCGPYLLRQWQTDRSLVFERKKDWWADRLQPTPFVLRAQSPQLQYLIMPDASAATLALRRHELDVYPDVPARAFRRLQASKAARQSFTFYTAASYDVVMAGFNTQQPALRTKYTRQALSLLFNPAALHKATQLGEGEFAVGLLPSSSPYYNDSLALPTYNPTRAMALLRQAGWQHQADGSWRNPEQATPLHVMLRYPADDNMLSTISLQWRTAATKLGIGVELRPTESSTMRQALRQGDFDMCVRLTKGNPFGFNFMPLLHTRAIGVGNYMRFGNPASDKLLETIAAEGNVARRRRLLRRFQAMVRDEAPLAPLFFLPYRLVADHRLRHLTVSGLKPGYVAAAIDWDSTNTSAAH